MANMISAAAMAFCTSGSKVPGAPLTWGAVLQAF
jgi:hypothetical protein